MPNQDGTPKVCKKCKVLKNLSFFNVKSRNKDGRNAQCKNCVTQYTKKFYSDPVNRKKIAAYKKEYNKKPEIYAKLKEWHKTPEARAQKKEYRNRPEVKSRLKEGWREYQLKKNYNLSVEDYTNLLKKQSHKCKICGLKTKLVVDHCHNSGMVRGLLCAKCNFALGLLNDNVKVLYNAINYLN